MGKGHLCGTAGCNHFKIDHIFVSKTKQYTACEWVDCPCNDYVPGKICNSTQRNQN